jgi:D-alanyl-D-alanine carboxypeptidase
MIDPSMAGAAGGHAMVTTVEDLARFMEAVLGGQMFEKAETLRAMTTMVEGEHESGLPYAYGLGLESLELPNGTKILGHAGGTGGYATMVYRIVGHGSILATSVNTGDQFLNALKVFMPATDAVRDEQE